jgi:hypothetical protein
MFRSLSRHPHTRIANANLQAAKEVRFFGGANWQRGIDWYRSLFPENSPDYKIFEATPDYYYDPCLGAIKQYMPDVKAILLLRNPTYRAWSIYWLYYRQEKLLGKLTYEQFTHPYCRPVQMGIYIECVKRWHSFFPRENLLILRSEDLFADTPCMVNQALDFLGLEKGYPLGFEKFDPLRHRKRKFGFPEMPPEVKKWLDDFYEPYNEMLYEYLGRDMEWH